MRDDDTTIYCEDEKEVMINEEHVSNNDIHVILAEISERSKFNLVEDTIDNKSCDNLSKSEANNFKVLSKEAESELYPGCKKFSKL